MTFGYLLLDEIMSGQRQADEAIDTLRSARVLTQGLLSVGLRRLPEPRYRSCPPTMGGCVRAPTTACRSS